MHVVFGTTAFTNGLIGSSGRAGQKRMGLLDRLAPSYGDDWWFTAHHGMAFSENGQHAAAHSKIDRSIAQELTPNPWAAHARAHLCYEQAMLMRAAFLRPGALLSAQRRAVQPFEVASALGDLAAGDAAAACRLFGEAFAPDHSGPPRGKLNDGCRSCGAGNSQVMRVTPRHGA